MPLTPSGFQDDRHDLVTVAIGNPAAGANLHWPCPTNHVVHVVGVSATLTTAAVAGNRWLVVNVENAGLVDALYSPSVVTQTIGLAWLYHWTVGVAPTDITADALTQSAPLGVPYQLKTGDFLNILILNPNAADQLSAITVRYYDWNED